ncbi:hypothetical protein APP_30010 [Aeribacillus pallidus]|nr:hypothetical protein APP_30010 [Aeribacillus pallidus]
MKIRVIDDHCKNCLWLLKGNLCPFYRCVKRYGFTHDQGDDRDE